MPPGTNSDHAAGALHEDDLAGGGSKGESLAVGLIRGVLGHGADAEEERARLAGGLGPGLRRRPGGFAAGAGE
jgi:hypothetical protein